MDSLNKIQSLSKANKCGFSEIRKPFAVVVNSANSAGMAPIVRPGRVEPDEGNAHQLSALSHPERLEYHITGVRIEPSLKLGEYPTNRGRADACGGTAAGVLPAQ